jgi:methylisocitrate lyase
VTKPSNPSPITTHHSPSSPGARLRTAIEEERPLQMVGAINAFCALPAKLAGFRAIYLSGAGVANASFGLPDLGITSLNDVAEECSQDHWSNRFTSHG